MTKKGVITPLHQVTRQIVLEISCIILEISCIKRVLISHDGTNVD
jgi:hypothetical protein